MNNNNPMTQVVIQGEYKVSSNPNCKMTTVLGSCVATCMFDSTAGIGGMNHFLLPGGVDSTSEAKTYGLHLMECLINGLLKRGAMRSRIQAKIFGGAYITKGLPDIGSQNMEFARQFLAYEKIPCVGESLGGNSARRVRFWPTTGHAKQLLIHEPNLDKVEQKISRAQAVQKQPSADLELF
ncbi:MAG: chemotaxis protein CheD [Robiginitomaculum sp.]|nr:MAG: chemotaxis protein CheD [Robiginitomaculum sp.]